MTVPSVVDQVDLGIDRILELQNDVLENSP